MSSRGRDEPRNLERLQRWMQAVITHPDGSVQGARSSEAQRYYPTADVDLSTVIQPGRALTAEQRLDIYQRAYFARLVECLREQFPLTRGALGDEAFDGFALEYLQRYPSRSYTLGRLGDRFAAFLDETRPKDATKGPSQPDWPEFLVELATLETTIAEVFDGPGIEDRPALDADRLLAIPPERWQRARLIPAPCLRLLKLQFPLNDYLTAAKTARAVAIPAAAETYLALNRRNYIVRRHALSAVQFRLLSALAAGDPIEVALAAAAPDSDDEFEAFAARMPNWFRDWAAARFFVDVEVPEK